jgi:hypothetical protein
MEPKGKLARVGGRKGEGLGIAHHVVGDLHLQKLALGRLGKELHGSLRKNMTWGV